MSLREWALRHATAPAGGNAVQDLLAGRDDATIVRERGLPRAAVAGVRTFYDQLEDLPRVCDGTACSFAGAEGIRERLAGRVASGEVRCLGHCYDAPAVRVGETVFSRSSREAFERWLADPRGPVPAAAGALRIPRMSLADPPVLLRELLGEPQPGIGREYDLPAPEVILDAVESYHLRGRGGAAFPTAEKWKAARDTPAPDRIIVANGDEGDPGSFVDRLLLEEAPHAILSGMIAAACVVGARRGIVYVRAEYPRALAVMRAAVLAARAAGHLGEHFDVEVTSGAGSYVCGEETAMLNSIEGLRGEPRIKPPYPSTTGLWGLPTVVQNVETLAIVSWLVRSGRGDGTKLLSLAGAVDWPGVVEVPLGTPLRRVLDRGRWRSSRGAALEHGDHRRPARPGAAGALVRHPALLRHAARHGPRRHRGARPDRHARGAGAARDALREGRVVRLLRAVPHRHRAAGADPGAGQPRAAARHPRDGQPVRLRRRRAAAAARPARALRGRGVRMMRIDGREVPARGSLLDACRAAGAGVPAFCADDRLSPGGHCRSCMVEMDGEVVAACTTAARDGAVVLTDTPALRAYRRDLGELMVAESTPGGAVGRTLSLWGVDGARYGRAARRHEPDASHAYLRLDLDACILCRRCVRACEEVQGQFVYSVTHRGAESRIAWGSSRFADSDCVACGACVTACPTGAISDVDRLQGGSADETVTRTTCTFCGVGCQMDVHATAERILRIDGAPSPVNHGHLCVKGRYAHGFTRHAERLTQPLIRRDGRLEPAGWDEALALVAREFKRLAGHVAALSSSRCTNEENYLVQKWFRAGLGTHDVDCCARVCHAPSAAGMREAFGLGAATNSLDDLEHADLILVVGANVTEAHPVTGARIKQAALRGARLIVIDPRVTELAAMADLHLQLRPGSNVPLFNSLAAVLVEEALVRREFIDARTEGWAEYDRHIRGETPERWQAVTGVPAERVREAARAYAGAGRPMMVHGLGVTEHHQGSEAVMLLCNLALLVGAVGRPGTGVNPLRGQNNVQGSADMGCQPDLLTGYAPVDAPEARERFERAWGRPLPRAVGRRLPEMYDAARAGDVKAMFILGEDVVQTDPDTGRTRAALQSLEFLVVQELFLSRTAELAHVVLPGASALEKDGTFTSGERRIQRVRRVLAPPGDARADWEILLALMAATGLPQRFRHPGEIMDEIAQLAPAFAGVSYARLDGDGLQWPVPDATHAGTPMLHGETFTRGRGRLTRVEYVPSPSLGGALTLVTGRVLEHYNAGTMTRRTGNAALVGGDALEIHPEDAKARGVADGDRVTVTSATGVAHAAARVTERVARGVVFLSFHFPDTDTNAVVGDVRDRLTDCPEYKVTAVEVAKA